MTTHENTIEEECRRAPLNGLIIGTVAGVAWAVEFLLPFYFHWVITCGTSKWLLSPCRYPWPGGSLGYGGRTVRRCKTPAKRKHRVKIIGVVMTTVIGMLLATIYYTFVAGIGTFYIPDDATLSLKAFVMYLAPLSVFLVAGWGLSIARINTPGDRHSVILKMSAWVALGLYLSVAGWFAISVLLDFVFFFEL